MKYATTLAAFLSLSAVVHARDGPYVCDSDQYDNFEIGGFNVPMEDYNSVRQYINRVWFKHDDVTILAAVDFDPHTLEGLGTGELTSQRNQDQGTWRGVGVFGGDTEISDDEGLYINFGGRQVKELRFGIRALFGEAELEVHTGNTFERGLVSIYRNGTTLTNQIEFVTDGDDGDDGQEFYTIISTEPFDAISFITYSHRLIRRGDEFHHDYFLEYLELCVPRGGGFIGGDPHLRQWSGEMYDYHGVCDLVLLQNPGFEEGLGLHIHVRTSQLKQFSYVSSAALQVGDDILEVMGDNEDDTVYWINRLPQTNLENGIVGFISGYPITYTQENSQQHKFVVDLGNDVAITLMTFKKIVRVDIDGATEETFGESLGLMGAYRSGEMVSRDGQYVFDDTNAFGQEWQVLPYEEMMFHNVEGPQAPEKCFIPTASSLRRRLGESSMSENEARIACAGVSEEDIDLCVFDVMATGDKDLAGAY